MGKRILANGRMDLCVFGCADTNDWLRYTKDMFTVELKEHPQWSQFDFHIRCYPIDPHNFPFQVRSSRRIRRAKTKMLIYSKHLDEMIRKNPSTIKHISQMLERGHLVVMPLGVHMQNVKHELKKCPRFDEIEFIPDSEAIMLFEKTIKLLVKPIQQVQEFLCFPQKMPDIRPLGEICLLAEDLLDPYSEYMLEFHQDGFEPISVVSDMLTAQSLTVPLPNELQPGKVTVKVYPWRFQKGALLGESTIEILPIMSYICQVDIVEFMQKYLKIDGKDTLSVVDDYLSKTMQYLLGKRDTVPGTINPFGFLASKSLTSTFAQFIELPAGENLDDIYDYDSGKPLQEFAPDDIKEIIKSSTNRLSFPPATITKSDFECQFGQSVSDDSGCPSEISASDDSRPPTPKPETEVKKEVVEIVEEVKTEVKAAPKKVIAPAVVPSKTGRNVLIEERMKRRTSFVKPVTKTKPVEPEIKYTRVCEAPSFSDCEDEAVKSTTPKPIDKTKSIPTSQPSKISKPVSPKVQSLVEQNSAEKPIVKAVEPEICKPELEPKPLNIAKIVLPNMTSDIAEAAKEAKEAEKNMYNPSPDIQELMDEDNKWIKRLNDKKSTKKKKVIKLKNGKVKKGSGFRYDKKRGYDRYWSSSEEETESSGDDDDEQPQFQLPSSFGIKSVKMDFGHEDYSDSDDDDKPLNNDEQKRVEKLYDGNAEYIRAKREHEREMREIANRRKK